MIIELLMSNDITDVEKYDKLVIMYSTYKRSVRYIQEIKKDVDNNRVVLIQLCD